MKAFAKLIQNLDSTNKTTQRTVAIHQFFDEASEADKLWFLALFTGKRPKRAVNTSLMREWVLDIVGIPDWLFIEGYSSVGDLSETISLLLPDPVGYIDEDLSVWMEKIITLKNKTEEEKKDFVLDAWRNLPHQERFIFNKLLGGSFRVGVSSKGVINAIASYFNLEATDVTHSLMGDWNVADVSFEDLIHGKYTNTNLSKPYPFCLAYPIDDVANTLVDYENWQAEYKWDGIRGQVVKRDGEIFIWSRGEELVNGQFPELLEEFENWSGDFVIDGEILVILEGKVLNFSELQKRLNRKTITKKMLLELPIAMYVYDIIELDKKDLRNKPLKKRRELLEKLIKQNNSERISLSPTVIAEDLNELAQLREKSRDFNSEGLMLKHRDSLYHAGRKKGDWWKWKIDPLTIDAVLIYAQKGSGRRSSYYTDYTFAIKDNDKLVTIAKAYSGLTDKEIQEVSRFVNKNAVEKFGPVRTVKPELVFEIAFEGIGWSSRHKAGIALRFPRILRWRKDKTVDEIDELENVKKLIS